MGVSAVMSGTKMKRLEVFSLSLWFQDISIVSWLRRWPHAVTICCSSQVQKKSGSWRCHMANICGVELIDAGCISWLCGDCWPPGAFRSFAGKPLPQTPQFGPHAHRSRRGQGPCVCRKIGLEKLTWYSSLIAFSWGKDCVMVEGVRQLLVLRLVDILLVSPRLHGQPNSVVQVFIFSAIDQNAGVLSFSG